MASKEWECIICQIGILIQDFAVGIRQQESVIFIEKIGGGRHGGGKGDAAVYAAGGSRIELGNGDCMLHVEYYPDDDIPMGDELQEAMRRMADFTVAYENLLRDGQYTTKNRVEIAGRPVSRDGQSDTIWAYTRADGEHEILHLINLLGTDNQWRDERGKKEAPAPAEDLTVRYDTDKMIKKVSMASFELDGGMSRELDFEAGEDANGSYIVFTVPSLGYWNMIYME